MATNLKFLPELIPLVIDMDRELLHPEHWGKMELLSALSKDEDNWLKDMRISCMEEYIQYMYKRICSITEGKVIVPPHILNTQILINIIHHLKIYNVSEEDIIFSTSSGGILIDVKNRAVKNRAVKNRAVKNRAVKNRAVYLRNDYIHYYLDEEINCTFGPAIIKWYSNGNKKYEEHRIITDSYYEPINIRKNGPAITGWYSNGVKKYEKYYSIEKKTISDLWDPIHIIEWHENGVKKSE